MNGNRINIVLALVAAALLAISVASVLAPMSFEKEQARREQDVKRALLKIRAAEIRYLKEHDSYCGALDSLVAGGYLPDSLNTVPYSGGKPFELSVRVKVMKSGHAMPLMECGARYEDYLEGMDSNTIRNLTEEANEQGRYPGLKIGNINTPNNNAGNWE